MENTVKLRGLLIGAALISAAAVQAQTFQIASAGVGTVSGGVASVSEGVVYSSLPPGTLTSLFYSVSTTSFTGTGDYISSSGNVLDFSITYLPFSLASVGSSLSYTGTWTYTGGTGVFAGPLTGGGTLTVNALTTGPDSADTVTSLSGTLTPVPEPASFAMIGIGVVGLVARRRKA